MLDMNAYMTDTKGRLIPKDNIKEIDILRDQLVTKMAEKAKEISTDLKAEKLALMEDFKEFLELSAEQYNTKYGGKKGNVTLTSFDGNYKAVLAIAEQISFDERLQVAKGLIDNCIHRWSEGTRGEMVVLVQNAFQVDKSGKINRENVLGLRRLKIDDEEWQQAMEAITDSMQVTSTKPHLRFYERDEITGEYRQISVDFSSL